MIEQKLTKAELRVEIAKDVLKNLKTLQVLARNTYVRSADLDDIDYDKPSQKVARSLQKKGCEVCALGACFLSLVALKNKFDFGGAGIVTRREVTDRLRSAFSDAQMDLIERAFEWRGNWPAHPYGDEGDRLNTFACKYPHEDTCDGYITSNGTTRLRAIMKNIIKNNGTFKP